MKNSDMETGVVLGVMLPFAFVVYVAPVVLVNAWVLTKLWDWYLIPGFGVAPLRMVYAYGISLIVRFLCAHYNGPDDRKWQSKIIIPVIAPFFSLLLGWIGTFWL